MWHSIMTTDVYKIARFFRFECNKIVFIYKHVYYYITIRSLLTNFSLTTISIFLTSLLTNKFKSLIVILELLLLSSLLELKVVDSVLFYFLYWLSFSFWFIFDFLFLNSGVRIRVTISHNVTHTSVTSDGLVTVIVTNHKT